MFKLSKGSSIVIIIVSIIVAVLVIVSVGGVIVWRYLQKSERESRDRDRDKDEIEDCGVSESFLADFTGLADVDFGEDEAMICMGENMQDRCKESEAVVKMPVGSDLTYEISGTKKSNCKVKVESYDPEKKRTSYIECPVLELASFAKEEEPEFEERLSGTPEDYAGFLFIMLITLGGGSEAASDIGCVVDVPGFYDSKIKSDLAQLRAMAEMYYMDNDYSYAGFTTPYGMVPLECSGDAYIVQISPDGQKYLAYAKLCEEDAFWCVDSEGFSDEMIVDSMRDDIYTCSVL